MPPRVDKLSLLAEAKKQARAEFRRQRSHVPADIRAERDRAIQHNLLAQLRAVAAQSVLAFAPLPGEPGGNNLPEVLLSQGLQVFLPRVVSLRGAPARGLSGTLAQTLEFADAREGCQAGTWGISEPVGPAVHDVVSKVDVCVVPAQAVDFQGARLGQGGGFYDRSLGQVTHFQEVWALVDHTEFVARVPSNQLDLTVSAVISDRGVTHINHR